MRLTELEAHFIRLSEVDGRTGFQRVASIGEADGVMFLCPVCFQANRGPVGTHMVICWSRRVPDTFGPGPGRWKPSADSMSLDDLTLEGDGGSSSVHLIGGCAAHFWVQRGGIVPA